MSATTGTPSRREVGDRDGRREALDPEVGRVHLEHERRLAGRSRARSRRGCTRFVVPTSRSRAPTDSSSSGIRNPSPISTISPRATTTSRPAAERTGDQGEGGRAVVDDVDRRRRRAPQRRARPACARPRGAAASGEQVELDVGGPGGGDHRVDGGLRERRAAEVGVDDDAGGVDDRSAATSRTAGGSPRPGRRRRRGRAGPPGTRSSAAATTCLTAARPSRSRASFEPRVVEHGVRARRTTSRVGSGRGSPVPLFHSPPRARDRRPRLAPEAFLVW